MTDAPLRDRLIATALLPFVTPARIRLLLEVFDPLDAVGKAPRQLLRELLRVDDDQAAAVKDPLRSAENRRRAVEWSSSAVTLADDDYPPLLREIIDPPLALFFRGDVSLAKKPCVAVVGSRRAAPYALSAASHLARQLASSGVAVVSGLARGIDGASHQAALDAGGATIAVLGTGIDIVYPRAHRKLFRAIAENGLVVTEFPPGTPPLAPHFPIRNRVISGLSLGTVIVEATGRSGSLITARTAAEQGREVFAVPGSIFASGSEGTHRLIQYGAKLVHDVNDILEELPGGLRAAPAGEEEPGSPLREVLAAFAREEATHVDAAAQRLGRAVESLSEPLLQLELEGWLRALPGGRYVRAK
jgi:DNA processing protein